MSPSITIAYRVYPVISKCPIVHSDNKERLVRLGLKSLVQSLQKIDYKFVAILDNCPKAYAEMIAELFPADRLEFIHLNGAGNAATFQKQIEVLESAPSDFIYFAEDDYFYMPECFEKMLQFANRHGDADFITPYFHPDYLNSEFHSKKQETRPDESTQWKTAGTTCMTFLCKPKILKHWKPVLLSFTRGCTDAAFWTSITQQNLWNIPRIARFAFTQWDPFTFIADAWLKNWRYHFRQPAKLWVPFPGLATHLESTGICNDRPWARIIDDFERSV